MDSSKFRMNLLARIPLSYVTFDSKADSVFLTKIKKQIIEPDNFGKH